MSLRRDRVLIVFYAVGAVVGVREFFVGRTGGEPGWTDGCEASAAGCFSIESSAAPIRDPDFWRRHAELTEIMSRVNPDDPDTDFLRAMQALSDGDTQEFEQRIERALATGSKHNGILLQYYAQYLLDEGAEWWRVNAAVNRWRNNHQFSAERLSLGLAEGPSGPADVAALQRELTTVPWLTGSELEPPTDADGRWRLWLSFRPGRTVDIRDVVAAVTLLSIPAEQRDAYEVTCQTLRDCRATRRSGR